MSNKPYPTRKHLPINQHLDFTSLHIGPYASMNSGKSNIDLNQIKQLPSTVHAPYIPTQSVLASKHTDKKLGSEISIPNTILFNIIQCILGPFKPLGELAYIGYRNSQLKRWRSIVWRHGYGMKDVMNKVDQLNQKYPMNKSKIYKLDSQVKMGKGSKQDIIDEVGVINYRC